ncbi:MAG: right-handed parallel beta-helix repeat-containing protein [Solobacterium sp.]|nr:right-handed parallel beta-helix repeat-containing protein [Solobacterium sp.]
MPENPWMIRAMGNAHGTLITDKRRYSFLPVKQTIKDLTEFELISDNGKFADSQDSFIGCYQKIDPSRENFVLSATLTITDTEIIDHLTGFGLMVMDTDHSLPDIRHRNHLLNGCFRTLDGRNQGFGVRTVSGYTKIRSADTENVRILDSSRTYGFLNDQTLNSITGDISLRLEKTDEGFICTCSYNRIEETIFISGTDFLTRQSPYMYAGIAAAGKIRLSVKELSLQITPGKISHTPEDTFRSNIPDYPFLRDKIVLPEMPVYRFVNSEIHVSPTGKSSGNGTPENPKDIVTAVRNAGPGCRIILGDGVYTLTQSLVINQFNNGTKESPVIVEAVHPRKAILDGKNIPGGLPLMILRSNSWVIKGLSFINAPGSGLLVCGNYNKILNCEASCNGDTGILICAYPGDGKEDYPSYNTVEDCDSYRNCDDVAENADGFGCKLRAGEGNVFRHCTAYQNADDGFDLYTKSVFGPIGKVRIEECIAYDNGINTKEKDRTLTARGTGFKLGGEKQPVPHEVIRCIAFDNHRAGFASNSNPLCKVKACISFSNGSRYLPKNYSVISPHTTIPGVRYFSLNLWLTDRVKSGKYTQLLSNITRDEEGHLSVDF